MKTYLKLLLFLFPMLYLSACSTIHKGYAENMISNETPFALSMIFRAPYMEGIEPVNGEIVYLVRNSLYQKSIIINNRIDKIELKRLSPSQLERLKSLKDKVDPDSANLKSLDISCQPDAFSVFDNEKCIYTTGLSWTSERTRSLRIRNHSVRSILCYLDSLSGLQGPKGLTNITSKPENNINSNIPVGNKELQILTTFVHAPCQFQLLLKADSIKITYANFREPSELNSVCVTIPKETVQQIHEIMSQIDSEVIEGFEYPASLRDISVFYGGRLVYHAYNFKKNKAPKEIQNILNIIENIDSEQFKKRLWVIWTDETLIEVGT